MNQCRELFTCHFFPFYLYQFWLVDLTLCSVFGSCLKFLSRDWNWGSDFRNMNLYSNHRWERKEKPRRRTWTQCDCCGVSLDLCQYQAFGDIVIAHTNEAKNAWNEWNDSSSIKTMIYFFHSPALSGNNWRFVIWKRLAITNNTLKCNIIGSHSI